MLKKLHTQYTISKNTSFGGLVFCMFGVDTCLIIFSKIYTSVEHVFHHPYIATLPLNQYKIFWKLFEV